jgi:uncharacterized damage-inducible protein DinB
VRFCIFFITIAFYTLSYRSDAQSIDTLFIDAAYTKLKNAAEYTLKVAELMPAECYAFKPSEGQMNFGQQLLHLSRNLGRLSSHYLNNSDENPVNQADLSLDQKDSVILVLHRSYDYALRSLKHYPTEQLKDSVSFFAGPMTMLQIINLINDHQTHHRGQLLVYLRMKGITPPPYIGW